MRLTKLAPLALVAIILSITFANAQRKVAKPWYLRKAGALDRGALVKDTDAYECAPGYKMYGKDCYVLCPGNQYMSPTRTGGQCLTCPRGMISPAGSAGSQACRLNTTSTPSVRSAGSQSAVSTSSSVDEAVQVTADPGTCLSGTGTVPPYFNKCVVAPKGSYAAGGAVETDEAKVVACPAGTTTAGKGSTNEGDCSYCLPGWGIDTEISNEPPPPGQAAVCTQAQFGEYSPGGAATGGNAAIKDCPTGYTTVRMGATMPGSCMDRTAGGCIPGFYAGGANPNPNQRPSCTIAPKGAWAPGGGFTDANAQRWEVCPRGSTTLSEGSWSPDQCTQCLPGWGTSAPDKTLPCTQATKGFFATGGARGEQSAQTIKCKEGTTTSGAGATSEQDCNLCLPGYGVSNEDMDGPQCVLARKGEFAAGGPIDSPRSRVAKCSPGTSTSQDRGATTVSACDSCEPGYGLINFASRICVMAQKGQYAPGGVFSSPNTRLFPCPQGTTTSQQGGSGGVGSDGTGKSSAADCSYCLPGWGTDSIGGSCRIAKVGEYAPGGDTASTNTKVQQCPSGTTTQWGQQTRADGTGSDSEADCSVCLPGWGTSSSNPQGCSRASVDQWAPGGPKQQPNTALRNCPEGTSTTLELGGQQAGTDNDDQSDCRFCKPGFCTPPSGFSNKRCIQAQERQYAPGGAITDSSAVCKWCETGYTTSQPAMTTSKEGCDTCLPGYGTTLQDDRCSPAPNGQWAAGGYIKSMETRQQLCCESATNPAQMCDKTQNQGWSTVTHIGNVGATKASDCWFGA